jgi:type II secretory pathway pseudopilin PulG
MIFNYRYRAGENRADFRESNQIGTTLIELLVVIVVFLIGILAVIQIFPKGFQILVNTRNNSVAAHLSEDMVEFLKQHADQLPQQILSVHYVNGSPVEDAARDPYDLGPQGDAVDSTGLLSLDGNSVGNWLLYSGPNSFRRVVGEGSRVPAPRPVGTNYGGLMVLNFGPIDPNTPVTAYANDLAKDLVLPPDLGQGTTAPAPINVTIGTTQVASPLYDSSASLSNSEYFATNPTTNAAGLLLPTNSLYSRTYHLRFAAYILNAGNTLLKNFPDLLITVPPSTATDSAGNLYPLVSVPFTTILQDLGQFASGESLTGVDYDSIQVAQEYVPIAYNATFSDDPLQYKMLDSNLGVLLFNPVAYSTFIEQPGGAREPLEARVSYDVYDWRILRQEFRLDDQQNLNGGNYGQFSLALQSINVGGVEGPDGLPNGPIVPLETGTHYAPTQSSNDDNFTIVDMQTGGIVYEVDPNNALTQLVSVNKSTGLVTVNEDGSGPGLMGYLAIPDGSSTPANPTVPTPTLVNLSGRSLRVLYRARKEFSVNVLKSAATYALVETPPAGQSPAEGQMYSTAPGIYVFPRSDIHQQIVVDTINYTDSSGGFNILHGQSFQIEATATGGGLPTVNLNSTLPSGATITNVQGIKGASIIVQVLWNPDEFKFSSNGANNLSLIDTWERGWRRNTNETTLPAQELQ